MSIWIKAKNPDCLSTLLATEDSNTGEISVIMLDEDGDEYDAEYVLTVEFHAKKVLISIWRDASIAGMRDLGLPFDDRQRIKMSPAYLCDLYAVGEIVSLPSRLGWTWEPESKSYVMTYNGHIVIMMNDTGLVVNKGFTVNGTIIPVYYGGEADNVAAPAF